MRYGPVDLQYEGSAHSSRDHQADLPDLRSAAFRSRGVSGADARLHLGTDVAKSGRCVGVSNAVESSWTREDAAKMSARRKMAAVRRGTDLLCTEMCGFSLVASG